LIAWERLRIILSDF
uniref:Uncharacterized protein n=1 Tax=Amphimedon queenslandica TaxID=400682 RepID=A0A1X7SGP8_AMPQE